MTPPTTLTQEKKTKAARILTPGTAEPFCEFEYPDLGPGEDPTALIVHITRDDMSRMVAAAIRLMPQTADPNERALFMIVPTLTMEVTLHREDGRKPN